nr:hypothetical protein [Tanacetum cinerariifolium]
MVREYTMLYMPLDCKIFVEFCRVTSVKHSSLPIELCDRYVFEFILFNMLGSRARNDTYLTGGHYIIIENEGGSKSTHPYIRKIIMCDTRDMKLRISLWGKLALKYTDDMIRSQKDTNIIIILTSCMIRCYGGGLQLTTTVATHFYLNLHIANCHAYNQRPIQPVDFPSNVSTSNVSTSNGLKIEEINITTIPDFYQHLANGVNVVQVSDNHMYTRRRGNNYVLFNTIVNQLLAYMMEELLTKSVKEGADVLYWLADFFVDKLISRSIVLRIKIDKYNLAPTFVHRTIIDTFEGSPARATMTNEDNPSDTHTDSATSHAYNDVVYIRSEALKEADTKVFDTKEVVMMEVDMKECDIRQVDVKEVVIDEEDTKESNVKKYNMKQVDVKEAVMDEENTKESYVKKIIRNKLM